MTILEVTLDLPDRLAREALAAGLLTPKALREMVKYAMQPRPAQTLMADAEKATKAGSKPQFMKENQAEANAASARPRAARLQISWLNGSHCFTNPATSTDPSPEHTFKRARDITCASFGLSPGTWTSSAL